VFLLGEGDIPSCADARTPPPCGCALWSARRPPPLVWPPMRCNAPARGKEGAAHGARPLGRAVGVPGAGSSDPVEAAGSWEWARLGGRGMG